MYRGRTFAEEVYQQNIRSLEMLESFVTFTGKIKNCLFIVL
jgi:hypothetical protein